MNIELRQENKEDMHAVYAVNLEAFGQESEARLVDALRKNTEVFIPELSLIATDTHTVIGHILFTKIKIVDSIGTEHESLALAPMSVKTAYQRKGIGSQLVIKGLDVARRLNFKSVIVLGHKDYYPKFGFRPASLWGIQAPFDVLDEAFMAIELVEKGLKNVAGTVKYPEEFTMV